MNLYGHDPWEALKPPRLEYATLPSHMHPPYFDEVFLPGPLRLLGKDKFRHCRQGTIPPGLA